MMQSRRIDLFELECPSDEELPAYSATDAPEYEALGFGIPTCIYGLCQMNRKTQRWVPRHPTENIVYDIKSRRSLRVFSKEPDLEMLPQVAGEAAGTSASIWFDDNGPWPWRPRAYVSLRGLQGAIRKHSMESRNFSDWTVELGGAQFVWRLEANPVSLVLCEEAQQAVLARFTYSSAGTMARHGAEVGKLEMYSSALADSTNGFEKIMASVLVSITHFKKMGRRYWNAETP